MLDRISPAPLQEPRSRAPATACKERPIFPPPPPCGRRSPTCPTFCVRHWREAPTPFTYTTTTIEAGRKGLRLPQSPAAGMDAARHAGEISRHAADCMRGWRGAQFAAKSTTHTCSTHMPSHEHIMTLWSGSTVRTERCACCRRHAASAASPAVLLPGSPPCGQLIHWKPRKCRELSSRPGFGCGQVRVC